MSTAAVPRWSPSIPTAFTLSEPLLHFSTPQEGLLFPAIMSSQHTSTTAIQPTSREPSDQYAWTG